MPSKITTENIPFSEAVAGLCLERNDSFVFEPASPEAFASLDYAEELQLKNASLKIFWKENRLPGTPGRVIPSRAVRKYRSNSKRKAMLARNGRFSLVHPGMSRDGGKKVTVSELEPDTHAKVYAYLAECFSLPQWKHAASALHYVILRGTEKIIVILNFRSLDAGTVRKMKQLSAMFKEDLAEIVTGFFLYLDETDSKYYLESVHRQGRGVALKKMFGSSFLDTALPDGKKMLYPPIAFSQVNESMIPVFLDTISSVLKPEGGEKLLDLYCGSGLIGLSLCGRVRSVTGMELEGPAVDAAENNAHHLYPEKSFRYLRGEIGPAVLREKLPPARGNEIIILDPPRSGTADGVIRTLAQRGAEKVLHIFCNADAIPDAVREWCAKGYLVSAIRALDMFPGTPNLEIMVLFTGKNEIIPEER